jgi:hypothetical protein
MSARPQRRPRPLRRTARRACAPSVANARAWSSRASRLAARWVAAAALLFGAAVAADADAQSSSAGASFTRPSFTWRAHVTDEGTAEQPNVDSPFAAADRGDAWLGSNELVASADGTWDWQQRVKVGAGLILRAPSDDGPDLRVREAYARTSLLPWLDVEAGKRLVRWGTGYAFTPTGLLDPPRDATDPQDRLGLNEGMLMARLDAFRGSTAVTLAAAAPRLDRPHPASADTPRRLLALRVRTTIAGVELAGVASAADNQRVSLGANFTHVVGRQLEYHGELLMHDDESAWRRMLAPHDGRPRRVSGLIGFQYTFNLGLNAIAEYYHDGNGLSSQLWSRLMDGAAEAKRQSALDALAGAAAPNATSTTGATSAASPAAAAAGTLVRPTRRDFLFLRASRANTDALLTPELIVLIGLNDGGLTLVPTLHIAPTRHVQLYVRGLALTGRARSADGSAPIAATLSAGLTVLF